MKPNGKFSYTIQATLFAFSLNEYFEAVGLSKEMIEENQNVTRFKFTIQISL